MKLFDSERDLVCNTSCMKLSLLSLSILIFFLLIKFESSLQADDKAHYASQEPEPSRNLSLSLGVAFLGAPAFLGSKDYYMLVAPDLSLEFKDIAFLNFRDGLGVNVFNSHGLKIGPVMKPALGRDEDGFNPFRITGKKTEALRGLGDVGFGIELGGFADFTLSKFSLRGELLKAIGAHNAWIGETSLKYSSMFFGLGPPIIFAFGPELQFASSKFSRTYWGVTSKQAAASGLSQYTPGSGIVSYGLSAFALMPLVRDLAATLFFAYDRLAPDLAKSSFIKQKGSSDQFGGGIGLSYKFTLIE